MARGFLVGCLIVVATTLAGCSGGGHQPSAPGPADAAGATTTTTPTFTGVASKTFCDKTRRAELGLGGLAGATTPDATKEELSAAVGAVHALAAVSPGEIAGDVKVMVAAYDDLLAGLRKAGWELSKLPPETTRALEAPQVRTASDRLRAYERDVCGIAPGG